MKFLNLSWMIFISISCKAKQVSTKGKLFHKTICCSLHQTSLITYERATPVSTELVLFFYTKIMGNKITHYLINLQKYYFNIFIINL